ncbi:MAG: 3-oxoacyl-ACP reductase [Gammaproteobacteria bacterium]|nr:3-oxoacyl-ACP reductase [Gammaproteobacteria bacterium]
MVKKTTQAKVAFITGASAGIGKAAGIALLNAGWHVVFAARRREVLEQVVSQCDQARALAVVMDVGDRESVKHAFARTQETFGRLDLLFNNAGRGAPAMPFEDLPYETWLEVINTNLNGMFLCAQEAFRRFKNQTPQGGRIINNGSISAQTPRPMSVAYTTTKHGVTGLTKSIALDGRAYNICGCQIDIGNAATEMTQRMSSGALQPDGSTLPEARMDVSHVAQTILHIANLPLDTNMLSTTIMANEMPFVGRG